MVGMEDLRARPDGAARLLFINGQWWVKRDGSDNWESYECVQLERRTER